jgi:Cu+-exporting ATPase
VALVFLGQVLELRARERTGSAIRALLDLAPKTARRIARPDGAETDVPLDETSPATGCGCGRAKRAGRRRRVEGRSSIDESMITGEPCR